MAWGRSNEQWNHTASIMATLASIYGGSDGAPVTVATFHPYMRKPEPPKASGDVLAMYGFKPVEAKNGQ
jgi:hypothetical protein